MRILKPAVVSAAALALTLTACSAAPQPGPAASGSSSEPIQLGVVGASSPEWAIFKEKATAEGITVDIKDFTDYTTPNPALSDGSLDANQFQHILYLARYNKDNGGTLVPIASTAIYPLALYSQKYETVEAIEAGAQIAVPNDETNKSRAIHLLASAGLLTLKEGTGVIAGEEDIDAAASKVTVSPMDAQQTVTALPSIAGAVVNNDFVNDAGLDPESALVEDDPSNEASQPYINVLVVRAEDADDENLTKLGRLLHDEAFSSELAKQSADSAVLVDKTPEELKEILDEVTANLD
ncbi:MAG: MetQ/NlpA family ABC transporter substrate-binding protein [Propionibacteriaceae bacterium]|nr:MetQ/NlpA family ABC transporter substrate-binding protein [Propionibacteriaceae bacterium]